MDSERLKAVAALAGRGDTLADIGCDHGYLGIGLIKAGCFKHVIAMDLREGPLNAARKNIREEGLTEEIECRLSDGCDKLKPGEADVVCFAGMGGALMIELMERALSVIQGLKRLVLQPQSEVASVRRWLWDKGFTPEAEAMIYEDGKYYPMMAAVYGGRDDDGMPGEAAFEFGGLLLKDKDPVLRSFLEHKLIQEEEILAALKAAGEGNERRSIRMEELKHSMALIMEALGFYEA